MMEDYERANAREWDGNNENADGQREGSSQQQVDGFAGWEVVGKNKKGKAKARASPPKQRVSPQKQHNRVPGNKATATKPPARVPPKLIQDVDNEAQQLWRQHARPQDTIHIPDELAFRDSTHEALAEQHGAFIFSEHDRGLNGSRTFGIWGQEEAVSATKRAIYAWIAEWKAVSASGSKSPLSKKYAKVMSPTPGLRKRAEDRWKREVKKQKYRQHPPLGAEFDAIGSFHWPTQEYSPEEVLGMSYEALDPIRMDCECYVVFNKDRSIFQVSGKAKDVQLGLSRLRGTYLQILAKGISHVRVYLLQNRHNSGLPSQVELKDYDHPKVISNEAAVENTSKVPHGKGPMISSATLESGTNLNESRVGLEVMHILKKLRYYAGDIQMRVRLGTFLAKQFRKPTNGTYELEEFQRMISESQFMGLVTPELGNREIENVALASLQKATDFLQPADTFTVKLEDVIPVHSVTFIFEGKDNAGDLCFTKSWMETHDTGAGSNSFEEIQKKWTRLERNATDDEKDGPTAILDISLSDLNTSVAWQFEIEASHVIDESRLSKALMDFSYSVDLVSKAAGDGHQGQPSVTYKPYPVNLKSMQRRWSYRYDIRTPDGFLTDYTLDLTRFEDRTFPPIKDSSLSSLRPAATVYEQRWGLSVYRTEWATMFTKNANLKIGDVADWKDDVETWFPTDFSETAGTESEGAGIAQLMEKLEKIQQLVENMKEKDLMDGMKVG